jgi:HAD superfamily hydrolase (TIGR01509 family)
VSTPRDLPDSPADKLRGAIFDFNGTLYWDSAWQESSWDEWLEGRGFHLDAAEKREHVHGRNGRHTFEHLFGHPLDDDEIARLTEEKESLYRAECLRRPAVLAPGAAALLSALRRHGIPMAIATASGRRNIEFFMERFGLDAWFPPELIVFDDGTLRGKPHPDLFLEAARRLGLPTGECAVFEDSASGVAAAENAGAGAVIVVDSTSSGSAWHRHRSIRDFGEIDPGMFG